MGARRVSDETFAKRYIGLEYGPLVITDLVERREPARRSLVSYRCKKCNANGFTSLMALRQTTRCPVCKTYAFTVTKAKKPTAAPQSIVGSADECKRYYSDHKDEFGPDWRMFTPALIDACIQQLGRGRTPHEISRFLICPVGMVHLIARVYDARIRSVAREYERVQSKLHGAIDPTSSKLEESSDVRGYGNIVTKSYGRLRGHSQFKI